MKSIVLLFIALSINLISYGQQITLHSKNIRLRTVLDSIERQTGIYYYTNSVNLDQTLTHVAFKSKDIKEVLDFCLSQLRLKYELKNNVIKIYDPHAQPLDTSPRVGVESKIININGSVIDDKGERIPGVSIRSEAIKGVITTDSSGNFELKAFPTGTSIQISHMGYYSLQVSIHKPLVSIQLQPFTRLLKELVVSTGYQQRRMDQTTGSYVLLDSSTLNRSVTKDILSRLNGVTNGMLFDAQTGNTTGISIRGRSTIYSETRPLVILDNFPFEGDLNTINPNDIQDITILKDASASAIWGVRAGNGVIVMSTKKGSLNQKSTITLNANITIGDTPDLYYQPRLSSSEFVDLEKFLYEQGNYIPALSNPYQVISPVVALLSKKNQVNAIATEAAIDQYRQNDVRNQLKTYFYQPSRKRQYYLSFSGGSTHHAYHISGGYDDDRPSEIGSNQQRYTLKLTNNYEILKNKLSILTNLNLTRLVAREDLTNGYMPLYPYESIADVSGNPLPVLVASGLRASYTDTAGNGSLLNWQYRPLAELRQKSNTFLAETNDLRINTGLNYKIFKPLRIGVNYQYGRSVSIQEHISDMNSYVTRNAINEVTRINKVTDEVLRPLPLGALYGRGERISNNAYTRAQLEYNDHWNQRDRINAIAGYELRAEHQSEDLEQQYGYDIVNHTHVVIDQITPFPFYYKPETKRLGINLPPSLKTTNNYVSYYANITYIYNQNWILGGSYRKDASNLFGVSANRKGVPLYSMGVTWKVSGEKFYALKWLSLLQIRASYGYNGNVNKTLSALTTTKINKSRNYWDTPFSIIDNPPNPYLRWERIKNVNIGADFSSRNGSLSGSIEYYNKSGIDLIGTSAIASQTGLRSFTGNIANTRTNGIDIQLNLRISNKDFKWNAIAIYNLSKDKVTKYAASRGANKLIAGSVALAPIVGFPINSIFSFKYGGLDEVGDPRGYTGGVLTKNYTAIVNATNFNELKFEGSAVPVSFGSFRNTFQLRGIGLSLNISYKLGYYFRAGTLNYSSLIEGGYLGYGYSNRWVKAGDERKTDVPAITYPSNPVRDQFYNLSEATTERADHIRLNDIQLNFTLPDNTRSFSKWKGLNIYAYANNLGIIWRANRRQLDPDARIGYPAPFSISIGLKKNFN